MNLEIKTAGGPEPECRHSVQVTAYHAGELSAREQQAFESHLVTCPVCKRASADVCRTLKALKAVGCATVRHDLTPLILSRLKGCATRPASAYRARYAAAAAMVLIISGLLWFRATRHPCPISAPPPAISSLETYHAKQAALTWLYHTQAPDGSWSTDQWGGDKRFSVALSSLATLALLETTPLSGEHTAAIRRSAGYLVNQQQASGEIGPSFSSAPYNHGMATLALLRTFEALRDESLREPLDRALEVIRNRQTSGGGWGYWGAVDTEPNLSVTLWQIEALKLAATLGWDAAADIQRAVQWVMSVANGYGQFGYRYSSDFPEGPDTLTAIGALVVLEAPERALPHAWREKMVNKVYETATDTRPDYYRTYFVAAAIKSIRDDAGADRLASVRQALVDRQVAAGTGRGSWDPDARWGGVGGRIYATAMASMALQ